MIMYYLKSFRPEVFQICFFLKFWNICIYIMWLIGMGAKSKHKIHVCFIHILNIKPDSNAIFLVCYNLAVNCLMSQV